VIVIGVDPGKSGGIAWTHEDGMRAEKMPDTIKGVWDLISHIVNDSAMIYRHTEFRAYLEQVCVAPSFENSESGKKNNHRMGAKSAFTFGNGFGHLEMALTAAGIPFERVSPKKWQTSMGCLTGGNKTISKARAQELFPSIKCTHAISDCLLITEYGVRANR
jgi:hypothetical protein